MNSRASRPCQGSCRSAQGCRSSQHIFRKLAVHCRHLSVIPIGEKYPASELPTAACRRRGKAEQPGPTAASRRRLIRRRTRRMCGKLSGFTNPPRGGPDPACCRPFGAWGRGGLYTWGSRPGFTMSPPGAGSKAKRLALWTKRAGCLTPRRATGRLRTPRYRRRMRSARSDCGTAAVCRSGCRLS